MRWRGRGREEGWEAVQGDPSHKETEEAGHLEWKEEATGLEEDTGLRRREDTI